MRTAEAELPGIQSVHRGVGIINPAIDVAGIAVARGGVGDLQIGIEPGGGRRKGGESRDSGDRRSPPEGTGPLVEPGLDFVSKSAGFADKQGVARAVIDGAEIGIRSSSRRLRRGESGWGSCTTSERCP